MRARLPVILFLALAAGACGEDIERPNVILIMADDLGFETVGSYGGISYATPNIDRLAAEGMLFENAHAQPLCTPSRVEIMTGRHNSENYEGFGFLSPDEITFAHILKDAGYATAIGGKWQLAAAGSTTPRAAGFDEYVLWQTELSVPERYWNPTIDTDGEIRIHPGEYGPDIINAYLLDFIERKKDVPFFVYYPMILPHWPFVPTPDSPDPAEADCRPPASDPDRWIGKPKYFGDMVTYMDELVGRIVAKVDDLQLGEKTLILFLGDNGSHWTVTSSMRGSRAVKGGKGKAIDSGTHVPFIVRWSGSIPAGRRNPNIVDLSAIVPTFAELVSTAIPSAVTGLSLLPELRGSASARPDWIYVYYDPVGDKKHVTEFIRSVRYKLDSSGNFYDLRSDRGEASPIEPGSGTAEEEALRAVFSRRLARREFPATLSRLPIE